MRQIVGWRELVRGLCWHCMPWYIENNALDCEDRDKVPGLFTQLLGEHPRCFHEWHMATAAPVPQETLSPLAHGSFARQRRRTEDRLRPARATEPASPSPCLVDPSCYTTDQGAPS